MKRIYEKSINPIPWNKRRLEQQYNRPDRNSQIKELIPWLDKRDTILDVGIGGGIEIRILRKMGVDNLIDACDYCQNSIDFINSKFLDINECFVCDITKGIKKENNSYDIVMALELIEHLENPKSAIKEMIRIAKKKVIITCPYKNTFCHRQHHWSIDEDDIKSFSNKKCEIKIIELAKSKSIIAIYYI